MQIEALAGLDSSKVADRRRSDYITTYGEVRSTINNSALFPQKFIAYRLGYRATDVVLRCQFEGQLASTTAVNTANLTMSPMEAMDLALPWQIPKHLIASQCGLRHVSRLPREPCPFLRMT